MVAAEAMAAVVVAAGIADAVAAVEVHSEADFAKVAVAGAAEIVDGAIGLVAVVAAVVVVWKLQGWPSGLRTQVGSGMSGDCHGLVMVDS